MNTKSIQMNFVIITSLLLLSACLESFPRRSPTPSPIPPLETPSAENDRMDDSVGNIYTSQTNQEAGTLHTVIIGDTLDGSIGDSVKIDLQKMQDLVEDISQNTGLATAGEVISGNQFTRYNLLQAIENISVGSNDIVWFFYSGHGFNPGNSKWPGMNLDDGTLTLTEVRTILKQKNPRLLIVMADTCNSFTGIGGFRSSMKAGNSEYYRELFLKYRGTITASSSKPGQYSWGSRHYGGLYTNAFLKSLNKELALNTKPSWEAIIHRANAPINAGNVLQQPQATVKVEYIRNSPIQVQQPIPPAPIIPAPAPFSFGTCSKYYPKNGLECCQEDSSGREHCWKDD